MDDLLQSKHVILIGFLKNLFQIEHFLLLIQPGCHGKASFPIFEKYIRIGL